MLISLSSPRILPFLGLLLIFQYPLMAWQDGAFSGPLTTRWDHQLNIANRSFHSGLVNQDAFPDLAIVTFTMNTLQAMVAYGDGTGGFGALVKLGPSLDSLITSQWGDIDGNGFLDLAVLHTNNTFQVFLNPGMSQTRKTYNIPSGYKTGFAGPRMFAGDGDGDGDDDLFFFTFKDGANGFPTAPIIAVLVDGGASSDYFQVASDSAASIVTTGRFNNDNITDLWLNGDRVLLSSPDGSHQLLELDIPKPNLDLNGDGLLDIAIADGNRSKIHWNNGNGSWDSALNMPTGFNSITNSADFNNDGYPDLYGSLPGAYGVQIAEGQAIFNNQIPISDEPAFVLGFMQHADFNQDGKMDLVLADSRLNRADIFLNGFQAPLPEIVSFTASPQDAAPETPVTLTWEVANASDVKVQPNPGSVDASGSVTLSLLVDQEFTLTATNESGPVTETLIVRVKQQTLPEITVFSVSPEALSEGDEVQLIWEVQGANRVFISPLVGEVDGQGTRTVRVDHTTWFNLTAENEVGDVGAQIAVSTLTAPDFITPYNYWLGEDGQLVCYYPNPGVDGVPGDLTYRVSFYDDCKPLLEPVIVDTDLGWPITLEIPSSLIPPGDFQIGVSRVPVDNPSLATAETVSNGPRTTTEPSADSPWAFSRWLLHIPKLAGGFASEIKLENANPNASVLIALWAFDSDGALLAVEEHQVPAAGIRYHQIYQGQDALFRDYVDKVSHISVFEQSRTTRVSLRYISQRSGFGAWSREVELNSGQVHATTFSFEGRGTEEVADGLAVLNLLTGSDIPVRAVQLDRNGNMLNEALLGTIPPGGKRLFLLSDLFPYQPNTRYRIESMNGLSFQTSALVFSGNAFFTINPIDPQ